VSEWRAHDKEAPIRCHGLRAVAVFMHGDVVCARCGEVLVVTHSHEQLVASDGRLALVLPPEHPRDAKRGANLTPPAA